VESVSKDRPLRVITLGSDRPHPLTRAALSVVNELEGVEHVDHLTANDARAFLRDVRSPAYREHIAGLEPDLLLSAAYARIVPDDVLGVPTLGAINVHPSLLPDYRGVGAVWWALYEGRSTVGVTIHQMTVPVDTGPILAQASLDVTPDAVPVEVWRTLGDLALPLLRATIEKIHATGGIAGTPQPAGGSYRSQPHKELRRLELDWSLSADELHRRSRIFPGSLNIPALRWRVFASSIDRAGPTTRPPGSVLRRRRRSMVVATGNDTSVLLVLARPTRAWTKLFLLHLATGRLRSLPRTDHAAPAREKPTQVG
jgi:methionyl-tRNA formyltransferase